MISPATLAIAVIAVVGIAGVLLLVVNLAEPTVVVEMEWPTPHPTPLPTRTPKPTTRPSDEAAVRMAWLPDDAVNCGGEAAAGESWLSDQTDCDLTGAPLHGGDTGALGTGVIHFPACAVNEPDIGRYVLLVPGAADDPDPPGDPPLATPTPGYPEPTSLVIDGINQMGAWVRQEPSVEYHGNRYRPWVTAYQQRCSVWDGDRADISPHPLPTPTPGTG